MTLDEKRMLAPADDEKGDENDNKNKALKTEDDGTTGMGDGSVPVPQVLTERPEGDEAEAKIAPPAEVKDILASVETLDTLADGENLLAYQELLCRLLKADDVDAATRFDAAKALSLVFMHLVERKELPHFSAMLALRPALLTVNPNNPLLSEEQQIMISGEGVQAAMSSITEYSTAHSDERTKARKAVVAAFRHLQSTMDAEGKAHNKHEMTDNRAQILEILHFGITSAAAEKVLSLQTEAELKAKSEAYDTLVAKNEAKKSKTRARAEMEARHVAEMAAFDAA